ncbi:MAG: hypothetical protein QJR12_06280 [Mycobacterium sp.]|uniref:hypothetical protein n=1 Tax=Mycobacterium sp. TaxID=1785 RepID=UPI002637C3FC|nr:hypothetical protein [Mycobacterium sp.]MDI3313892.1 hypothetical protein [Mycobacterium sp.]
MHPGLHRYIAAALSAATVVVAPGLSGCSQGQTKGPVRGTPPAAPVTGISTPVAAEQTAPVPPPEALTDVLYRLADPTVPGSEKVVLVEGATPDSAATLDKFATALRDGGYAPAAFAATDIAWSDRDPATVVATINVTTPNRGVHGFSFPMQFKPYRGGWQLSQQTADMLLAFGASQPGAGATPAR